MQINIQSHNIEITEHLHRHIENRINDQFSNLNRKVQKISVRIYEFRNGYKNYKVICQIQVQTGNLPVLITESKADNVYSAIEHAVRRAKKNTSRKFLKLDVLLKKIKNLKLQKTNTRLLKLPIHSQQLPKELS